MKKWLKAAALAFGFTAATSASALVPGTCTGRLFNPVTDTDWNNIFPITIAGARMTSGSNTINPLMAAMPPICVCPTIFGIPFVGIGITYWQPLYVSEVEYRPGCLSSVGGVDVLPGPYDLLTGQEGSKNQGKGDKPVNRMQVHWYQYPVFSVMEIFKSLTCKSPSGFDLAYVTEVDPLWQDDMWSAVFAPESVLFSNPIAHAACGVDAVAASTAYPLDALFWCAGSWGNLYPLSGNSSHTGDWFASNNQVQAKFIARNARMGLQWQTIGPTAICSSHPNPVWVKSQYRYNQVGPIRRKGRAVSTGDSGKFFQFPPITNTPVQEQTINLIWQGQQCCLKPIP